ncbi:MAG TPA: hypothetical protein VGR53_00810 [Nitrososphaerales archaeon]|nr:hypothetical protein [Nitrososphaerales archaeon]
MPPDPSSIFGSLLGACIRDDYTEHGKRGMAEEVLCLVIGACTSVATTYLLSVVGIFV